MSDISLEERIIASKAWEEFSEHMKDLFVRGWTGDKIPEKYLKYSILASLYAEGKKMREVYDFMKAEQQETNNNTTWYTDKLPPKPDKFPNSLGTCSIKVWMAYNGMEDVGYYDYLESKWRRDEDGEVIEAIDAWCELPHYYKEKK
jgi:hypothetical protein